MAETNPIPTQTPHPPQAEQTVASFFDYNPERYNMAFRLFPRGLKQPFLEALDAVSKQDIPREAKYAAGQLLVGATLGTSGVSLEKMAELVKVGTPRRPGEIDNLYQGYRTPDLRSILGSTSPTSPLSALKANLQDLAQTSPSNSHVNQALTAASRAIEKGARQSVTPNYSPYVNQAIGMANQMGLAQGDPLRLQMATRLAGALYGRRHPGAHFDDAATIDAVVQAFGKEGSVR